MTNKSLGKLNVYIDPQLHTDTKIYAARTNQKLSEVVELALKEFLERHQNDK